jgi:MoaA/NifB/PqqE/SkfB family radical SAM enzyme
MTRTKGFLNEDAFILAVHKIFQYVPNHSGPIWLHGFGEPLLDKGLPDKIKILSSRFPQATIGIYSTLGVNVSEDYLASILENGLKIVHVSFYSTNPDVYREITGIQMYATAIHNLHLLGKLAAARQNRPEIFLRHRLHDLNRISRVCYDDYDRFKEALSPYGFNFIEDRHLHNYGDGRNYQAPTTHRICRLFTPQNVLQIDWELNVVPCCMDFDSQIIFGNLKEKTLDEIYESSAYIEFLRNHLAGFIEPYNFCINCDMK